MSTIPEPILFTFSTFVSSPAFVRVSLFVSSLICFFLSLSLSCYKLKLETRNEWWGENRKGFAGTNLYVNKWFRWHSKFFKNAITTWILKQTHTERCFLCVEKDWKQKERIMGRIKITPCRVVFSNNYSSSHHGWGGQETDSVSNMTLNNPQNSILSHYQLVAIFVSELGW